MNAILNTGMVQPNLFPYPFPHHLVFACISFLFFAFMFVKTKKPHQLIMAIAIPATLTLWISNSKALLYGVGIFELVAIITAIVIYFVHKKKHPECYYQKTDEAEKEVAVENESTVNAEHEIIADNTEDKAE